MSFFEKLSGAVAKERPKEKSRHPTEHENPYLTARRTWDDHVGSVVSSRQSWQVVGILSLMIALASVGGVVYIGSQSKFIPYVVEVDKLGAAQTVGLLPASQAGDPRVLGATVAKFIENARLVSPDVALQRKAVFSVYAHLASDAPATVKMNEWLNGHSEASPFKRAAKEMVSIEITSVLPQTATTWQVDWAETTRDRQGVLVG
ncbi:MAG: VirB8/TrbF family protein, partial [Vibrionaceae bacterium]